MKLKENMKNTTSQGTGLTIDPAIFTTLYELDISKHVETRPSGGNFMASYLSWSIATLLLKQHLPEIMVDFEKNEDNGVVWVHSNQAYVLPFLTDGSSRTPAIFFPVMDNRFNAIERPDVRAISDACQRGAVKAIAQFTGLGLVLYTGEEIGKKFPDTPEYREAKKVVEEADKVTPIGRPQGASWEETIIHFGKNKGKKLSELSSKQLSWYQNEWQPNPDFPSAFNDELRQALDESMGKLATDTGDPAMDSMGKSINEDDDIFGDKPTTEDDDEVPF